MALMRRRMRAITIFILFYENFFTMALETHADVFGVPLKYKFHVVVLVVWYHHIWYGHFETNVVP